MGDIYILMLVALTVLAIIDLVVGVSNDAVNFLNSAIGSKAISIKWILIIASAGVAIGAITSSGMMEVAIAFFCREAFQTARVRHAGRVHIAFELDVTAQRKRGNLPPRAMLVGPAGQLLAETDRKRLRLYAEPASDQIMAKFVDRHQRAKHQQKAEWPHPEWNGIEQVRNSPIAALPVCEPPRPPTIPLPRWPVPPIYRNRASAPLLPQSG